MTKPTIVQGFDYQRNAADADSSFEGAEDDKTDPIEGFNRTARSYPGERTIGDLFSEQARATPDLIAIESDSGSITYANLVQEVDQLARFLENRGVGLGCGIGVLLPRSSHLVVALLGILKAGGIYVPMNPRMPIQRLTGMMLDADVQLLITERQYMSETDTLLQSCPSITSVICMDNMDLMQESKNLRERGNLQCPDHKEQPVSEPSNGWYDAVALADITSTPFPDRHDPEAVAYTIFTSGTTGRPKGVAVRMKSLVNLAWWYREACPISSGSKVLQVVPSSFDASIKNYVTPLLVGGTLVLLHDGPFDPVELLQLMEEYAVTVLNPGVPSMFYPVVELASRDDCRALRHLSCLALGGEALDLNRLRPWLDSRYRVGRLLNIYGPTECTDICCWYAASEQDLSSGSNHLPIGRPVFNAQAWVLNEQLKPVPNGGVGQLYISGDGLAEGYVGDAELTKERFFPHPFMPGEQIYGTGDLVRVNANGDLVFTGRSDFQVKIRGHRIELGDVEACLLKYPDVAGAVVLGEDIADDQKRLVAYVATPVPGENMVGLLKEHVGQKLPDYMVPSAIVVLERFPLTPNGKIDRGMLPTAGSAARTLGHAPVEPRNAREARFVEIWRQVLGLEEIGVEDDFFALGGDSLQMVRLLSRLRADGHVIDTRSFLAHPMIGSLARHLLTAALDVTPPVTLDATPTRDTYPLSPMQHGMLFHTLQTPDSWVYMLQIGLTIDGDLDIDALSAACQLVAARHPILRTAFHWDGEAPVQTVAPEASIQVTPLDWSGDNNVGQTEAEQTEQWHQLVQEDRARGFELGEAPLLRLTLVRTGEHRHQLLCSLLHLLMAEWELLLFFDEMFDVYEVLRGGKSAAMRPPPRPFSDFIHGLQPSDPGAKLFWQDTLRGYEPTSLAFGFPLPTPDSKRPGLVELRLSRTVTEQLGIFARTHRLTVNTVLIGAFGLVLGRYMDREDVVFGLTLSGRAQLPPGMEETLGLFMNTLPLRLRPTAECSVGDYLSMTRDAVFELSEHEETALVDVHAWSGIADAGELFEAIIAFDEESLDAHLNARIQSLEFSGFEIHESSNYPLSVAIIKDPEMLIQTLYDKTCFDEASMEVFTQSYIRLIEQLVTDPLRTLGGLEVMDEAERHRVIVEWNDTSVDFPKSQAAETLKCFDEQVLSRPEKLAIEQGPNQLTYGELDALANGMAYALAAHGVGSGSRVAISIERSPRWVASLLACWKVGAAFVSTDADLPGERLRFIIEDAGVTVLITERDRVATLVPGVDRVVCWEDIVSRLEPPMVQAYGDMAYVGYTSGSSGQPKGVVINHDAVNNFVRCYCDKLGLEPEDRTSFVAALGFDGCMLDVLGPLNNGATICIPPFEIPAPRRVFRDWLIAERITLVPFLVTPLCEDLLKEDTWPQDTMLRLLATGGETLKTRPPVELPFVLLNLYGPTETTVISTMGEVTPESPSHQRLPSIGRPIANTQAYILDGRRHPVPIGVVGELYIAGAGLAEGYLNRPELTRQCFVANPFASRPGARMYRTGDLCRYLPDGRIEFIGRADAQIKILGRRVELGEIECTIQATAVGIRQAVVTLYEEAEGRRRLIAYLTIESGQSADTCLARLRAELPSRLPRQMVPSTFVVLPSLPLNENGKVDRTGLPIPEIDQQVVEPRTQVEELICGIWVDILDLEKVGVEEEFFALGGHSLHATRLVAKLHEVFGTDLTLAEVFGAQTVAEQAALITSERQGRDHFRFRVLPMSREPEQHLPLSYSQQRLWFLNAFNPESSAYNVLAHFYLKGPLDADTLEVALNDMVDRHKILRVRFGSSNGVPYQVIQPPGKVKLERLRRPTGSDFEWYLNATLKSEAFRKFDLEREALTRFFLIEQDPDFHVLIVNIHHIVFDGWSLGVFLKELGIAYTARGKQETPVLPRLPVDFIDYAESQKRWITEFLEQEQLLYWTKKLAGMSLVRLPTDRPRPPVTTFHGASLDISMSPALTQHLEALCREENATLFMGLLSGYFILLHRYTGQEDLAIATPVANRNVADTEGLIGFFVNTLIARCNLSGRPTFRAVLRQVREVMLEAWQNQDLPFDRVIEVLRPERGADHSPLVQTIFALQNAPAEALALEGVEKAPVMFEVFSTRFDQEFHLWRVDDGIKGSLIYNTDLFERTTVEGIIAHYQRIIEGSVVEPDGLVTCLSLLNQSEQLEILRQGTGAERKADSPIHRLVETVARRTPQQVAIECGETSMSYQDLNESADRLAGILYQRGVRPGEPVVVFMERSLEMIVTLLAIVKSGGCYAALSPGHPIEYNRNIIKDLGAVLAVTGGTLSQPFAAEFDVPFVDVAEALSSDEAFSVPEMILPPDSLCYVAFTSGSTGHPKGVSIPHRAVVRLVTEPGYVKLNESERVLCYAPLAFDASTFEIWGTLANGATLVVATPEKPSLAALGRLIRQRNVTTAWLTAGLFHLFLQERPEDLQGVQQLLAGGDVLQPAAVRQALQQNPEGIVVNGYGPTENTTFTCCHRMDRNSTFAESVPIGRAVPGTTVFVLDNELKQVPFGVIGELYTSGSGLASGYWNRPDLTAERFLPNPFSECPGDRMYRTGDLVRMRPDGVLEFVGRRDNMVKVSGYRIETGEIEYALTCHEEVAEALVIVQPMAGDKQIVAYVVPGMKEPTAAGETQRIDEWTQNFDNIIYKPLEEAQENPLNFAGWVSSYTSELIPQIEMDRWLADRIDIMNRQGADRILEIGCGTGLLLLKSALGVGRYVGTDISSSALDWITKQTAHRDEFKRVELLQQPAHDFSGLERFDLIVLNSTVQYFPSLAYLELVLDQALERTALGGVVFLGDLRDFKLLSLFKLSLEVYRASPELTAQKLLTLVSRGIENERELTIDSSFFFELQRRYPRITNVRISPQRGWGLNELTKFRYDVVLHLDGVKPVAVDWLDWQANAVTLEILENELREARPRRLGCRSVPNVRLAEDLQWRDRLNEEPGTVLVADLFKTKKVAEGIEPEALFELGDACGYRVELSCAYSDETGSLDVCFVREDQDDEPIDFSIEMPEATPSRQANDPGWKSRTLRLQAELRDHLKSRLPDYMVPAELIFLPAFPLNERGKIERGRLPSLAVDDSQDMAPPSNELERRIAGIWQDVLSTKSFGIHENFFEVGGHSQLVIRVCDRIARTLDYELTPVEMFQCPTISKLASHIRERKTPEASARKSAVSDRQPASVRQPVRETDIAIVGLAGRFPGAENPEIFWQNLADGVESISVFSDEELRAFGVPESRLRHPNYVKARGRLATPFDFDAEFFGYSPREAEYMDPQHRIFLECAHEALEDAGYDPFRFEGAIGVYAGTGDTCYLQHILNQAEDIPERARDPLVFFGNYRDFMVTRAAYKLNLEGPALLVQTACSSSLVSVIQASRALLDGQCDLALAGGSGVRIPHGTLYEPGGIASPDGHCRAFDRDAAGTVSGDGAAIVALRRLDEALEDGDHVYGIIRGFALNNDGLDKVGYTAPGIAGQSGVISAALEMAGGNIEDIRYVEAHGTGTALGDPVEISALTKAFRRYTEEKQFCAVGSVKSNIGHLDAAAGVVGLIKTLLALKHEQLPRSLHFKQANPACHFENSPFFVQSALESWPRGDRPRRAGVSSFGIGGTNAHLIVEEPPKTARRDDSSHAYQLLVFSARTPTALERMGNTMAEYLGRHHDVALDDVAFTLQVGRRELAERRFIVCRDASELSDLWPLGKTGTVAEGASASVAFMFSGQGSQYVGMGRNLYEREKVFREAVNTCREILEKYWTFDPLELIFPEDESDELQAGRINQTRFAQPILFVIEYALVRLLETWGIQPEAMLGHSVGEIVAAHVAGVFSLEDALSLTVERGAIMQKMLPGAMISVEASEAEIRSFLEEGGWVQWVSIAALNAPDRTVLSGPEGTLSEVLSKWKEQGRSATRLHTSHAFHSVMMEPGLPLFRAYLEQIRFHPPSRPLISNVTGDWARPEQICTPDYWVQHLRSTVRFSEGVARLLEKPGRVLLEVGPGNTLCQLAGRCRDRSEPQGRLLSTLPHPREVRDDQESILNTLGSLWMSGVAVNWHGFHADAQVHRQPLPTYPFERSRHLFMPEKPMKKDRSGSNDSVSDAVEKTIAPIHKEEDISDWFYVPRWDETPLSTTAEERFFGIYLIFIEANDFGRDVGRTLSEIVCSSAGNCTVLIPGSSIEKHEEGVMSYRADVAEDYDSVLKKLLGSENEDVRIIYTRGFTESITSLLSANDYYRDLLFLTQALGRCGGERRFELTLMTNHQHIVFDGEQLCPEKAALLGPGLVVPLEYPNVRCRNIDFDTLGPWLKPLKAELAQAGDESQVVAYRKQKRLVRLFVQEKVHPIFHPRLVPKPGGTYLITGGLGGVGLHLAEYLVQEYNARVVLTSRSPFPAPEDWDACLEERVQVDLADLETKLLGHERELESNSQALIVRDREDLYQSLLGYCLSCAYHYVKRAWRDGQKPADLASWRRQLRIEDRFERFFSFFTRLLEQHGLLSLEDGRPQLAPIDKVPVPEDMVQDLERRFPEFLGQFRLLDHCYRNYEAALSGDIPAIGVLYPEGRNDFLSQCMAETEEHGRECMYRTLLARLLPLLVSDLPGRPFRILEVGAGNGILTWELAPGCRDRNIEYYFTDLGQNFVLEAEKKARELDLKFMRFDVFDISRDGSEQGFDYGSFDLVVGLNVVHATPRLTETLTHLHRLLSANGVIALLESPRSEPWVDMVWGLAEGWWFFEDERDNGGGSPLQEFHTWESMLSRVGFQAIQSYPREPERRKDTDIGLILGQKQGDVGEKANWAAELTPDAMVKNRISCLRDWRDEGAEVSVYQADVTDEKRMREVIDDVRSRFGRLDGVVHTAFILRDGMMQFKDAESARSVMAPKVEGARILDRLLADDPPDFMVHCSSLASIVGLYAQSDYCAANAFLDAWAAQKTAEGLPSISVNWGIWRDTGAAMRMVMQKAVNRTLASSVEHPLIDYCFSDGAGSYIYSSSFDAGMDWVVAEHRLHGVATLPGTAFLELATGACKHRTGWDVLELHDVYFLELLTVENDVETVVRTVLTPQGAAWTFVIESLDPDRKWKKHATGRVLQSDVSRRAVNGAELRTRCAEVGSIPMDEGPVEFGPRWRESMETVRFGDGEAWAEVSLPNRFALDVNAYDLHPALLDLATGFALGDGPLYLPYRYGRICVFQPLPQSFWCHATFEADTRSGDTDISYDFTLFNEQGDELVRIEGYRLKPVQTRQAPSRDVSSLPVRIRATGLMPPEFTTGLDAAIVVGNATTGAPVVSEDEAVVVFHSDQTSSCGGGVDSVVLPLPNGVDPFVACAYLPEVLQAVYILDEVAAWHENLTFMVCGAGRGIGRAVIDLISRRIESNNGRVVAVDEFWEDEMHQIMPKVHFLTYDDLANQKTEIVGGADLLFLSTSVSEPLSKIISRFPARYGKILLMPGVDAFTLSETMYLSEKALSLSSVRIGLDHPGFAAVGQRAIRLMRDLTRAAPRVFPPERRTEAIEWVGLRNQPALLLDGDAGHQIQRARSRSVLDVHSAAGLFPELREGMSSAEGIEAFRRVMERGFMQVVVSTQNLDKVFESNHTAQILEHKQVAFGLKGQNSSKGDHLGLDSTTGGKLANTLIEIWHEVLGVENIQLDDSFFELKGDSLLAIKMISEVRERLGVDLTPNDLFENPTIRHLMNLVETRAGKAGHASLVTIRKGVRGKPTFFFHPIGGNVFCYASLGGRWPDEGAFYAFEAKGLAPGSQPLETIEAMAADCLNEIQRIQPRGAYRLGGWSLGGLIAFEVSRLLEALHETVESLVIIDSTAPCTERGEAPKEGDMVSALINDLKGMEGRSSSIQMPELDDSVHSLSEREFLQAALKEFGRIELLLPDIGSEHVGQMLDVFKANRQALFDYHCSEPLKGEGMRAFTFFARERDPRVTEVEIENWKQVLPQGLEVHLISGDHYSILQESNFNELLRHLEKEP